MKVHCRTLNVNRKARCVPTDGIGSLFHMVRQPETLQLGVYVLGCMYNLCTYHDGLRQPFYLAKGGQRWLRRTPAIAAGLTNHCWTVEELFNYRVPPDPWTPPKRRGRRSKETLALMQRWCL